MTTDHAAFVVIGGSYAGLSAALQLARARRDVLVIDAGVRRNRFAAASHGFLTQDGRPPADIAADGHAQLMRYPTVRWVQGQVLSAQQLENGRFALTLADRTVTAERLVLAIGVRDRLPDVPGLADRWGRSVFHCPYCHGFEVGGGPIGILAAGPLAQHQAHMLPDWGPTTLLLNGAFEPDEEALAALARRQVQIERTPVLRLDGHADVVLTDGRRLAMAGLFTQPVVELSSPIAQQLGCALDEGPMGPYIRVNDMKETTVVNVFACGDAARPAGNVAMAVADGAMAALAAHRASMLMS